MANFSNSKPFIVVISGPTGCGKSALGIELALALRENGGEAAEIINADSVALYRGFNIGASKPKEEEFRGVKHHLLSILAPSEDFDVGQFSALAGEKITELSRKGILPIVLGGSGLYIRALLCGLVKIEAIDSEARECLQQKEEQLQTSGSPDEYRRGLHNWLAEQDPEAASEIHVNDLQRVRRAILVKLSTGTEISLLQKKHHHGDFLYRALVFALFPDKAELDRKIDKRVDLMLEQGLIDEVKTLRSQYTQKSNVFEAIGYRHVASYLEGMVDYETMVAQLKRDTRRFAKRQMTWWRNQPKALDWEVLTEVDWRSWNCQKEMTLSRSAALLLRELVGRYRRNVHHLRFLAIQNYLSDAQSGVNRLERV